MSASASSSLLELVQGDGLVKRWQDCRFHPEIKPHSRYCSAYLRSSVALDVIARLLR
jgi:hypothetical protein